MSEVNEPVQETMEPVQSAEPPRTERPSPNSHAYVRSILGGLQSVLLALVIAVFVITFVIQAFRIPSGSMENTLLVGDYLLVDKARYGPSGIWNWVLPYYEIHRGDIIVFRYPVDPTQHFVKRVVGVPGDHVRLVHSHLYVNGRPIPEPYVVFKEHYPDPFRDNFPLGNIRGEDLTPRWSSEFRRWMQDGQLIVPAGSYFVMGDNRDQSYDSRYWGFVPRENIIGRPLVIYFSIRENEDDEGQDDRLFMLRTRVTQAMHELRWKRMLRLVP